MRKSARFQCLFAGLLWASAALAQTEVPAATPTIDPQVNSTSASSQPNPTSDAELVSGIKFPDYGSTWVLDEEQGKPKLLLVRPSLGHTNHHYAGNMIRYWPVVGQVASTDIKGEASDLPVHTGSPLFLMKQSMLENSHLGDAVNAARFAMVRLKVRHKDTGGNREVCHYRIGRFSGDPTREIDEVATTIEIVGDGSWLKISPAQPLTAGNYAVILIAGPAALGKAVYDFNVLPETTTK